MCRTVSIPCKVGYPSFQTLIGTMKTKSLNHVDAVIALFQTLIGMIETEFDGIILEQDARFQTLIGTI